VATEKYIMCLLSRSRGIIGRPELDDIIDLAMETPMYKVRVQLFEILRDMSKCFALLQEYKVIKEYIFVWLKEVELVNEPEI
jgi:hypothetical protein